VVGPGVGSHHRTGRWLTLWVIVIRGWIRPHKATTWALRGVTPIAAVTAKGSARVSVAGLACYRPSERSRLIYRTMLHRGRKGEPKGFREHDFARLLDAAHQQLQAPIVLVWDGLSAHKSAQMRALIAARPWLRVYQLPAYAPELNPVEKVWSTMKRALANLPARTAAGLATAVKNRLKRGRPAIAGRPTVAEVMRSGPGRCRPSARGCGRGVCRPSTRAHRRS
jgi:hypothetical protein